MSAEIINIEGVGDVQLRRRRGQKRIVLRVSGAGEPSVSAPLRTPKYVIKNFVGTKAEWLNKQISKYSPDEYKSGDSFRAGFSIEIIKDAKSNRSKSNGDVLTISLKAGQNPAQEQEQIIKYLNREIRSRAENFLPNRLLTLSEIYNLPFHQVKLKNLKSRWGSCTAEKNINLNIQLMNLPHELIDHVLLHELAHTVHLNHTKAFWEKLAEMDANYKIHRNQLKTFDTHRPIRHN